MATQKKSFREIVKGDTPVLIDFYAEWCGPCKAMAPMLKQLKSELGSKTKIIKIDVDKNLNLATQFKIMGVPTLILFKKGNIVWRQAGVPTLTVLKGIIEQHA